MNYISIKNLNVTFDKNKLFNDVSFNIKKSSLVALTTPSSKGKTTMLNIINGNIITDSVFIDNKPINEKNKFKITLINAGVHFYSKTVLEELYLVTNNIISEIILIDNIFSYFDNYSKIEYMGLLKKYQIDKGKTIIFTTNNLEDALFSDKIIVIDKEVLYDGPIDKIYLNEDIIKKSKLNIPLEHELLEKLKLYDVIDKVTYTIEEVVDEICK